MRNNQKIDWEPVTVLDKEPWQYKRKVLEAIYIKRERPQLNRDQGIEISAVFEPLFPPSVPAATPAPPCGAVGAKAAGGH